MNDFLNYNEGNMRWVIKREYSDKIIKFIKETFPSIGDPQPQNPKPEIQNDQSKATVVKSNAARSVKIVTIDNGDILYLKHNVPKGWRDIAKYTLFGSKAKRECMNRCKILKMGVSAGEPVAYGEKMLGVVVFDNFLMVKAIPESRPIRDFLSDPVSKTESGFKKRREVLRRLSAFIIKLHKNGILHKDLHTGNILVDAGIIDAQNPNASIRNTKPGTISNDRKNAESGLSIIDLHDVKLKGARYRRELSLNERLKNLANNLYSLTHLCSGSQVFFVMKEYLNGYLKDKSKKETMKYIIYLMAGYKNRHMLSRSKRCLKNSSGFSVKSYKNPDRLMRASYRVYFRKSYNKGIINEAIKIHNESRKLYPDHVIKNTPKVSVTAFRIPNNTNKPDRESFNGKICVKEHKNPGVFRQIREAVFSSRGKKAWYAANGFIVRKQITPMSIALVEIRKWGLLKSSLIISEYIEQANPVNIYVAKHLNTSLETNSDSTCNGVSSGTANQNGAFPSSVLIAGKRSFIKAFAGSFRNIHKEGIFHADLKAGNILVKEIGETKWEFVYLDLDRVSFKKSVTKHRIIKNLTQLNASLPNEFSFSDRMRFYKHYLSKRRLSNCDKTLLRRIIMDSVKRKHLWNPGRSDGVIKSLNC
ncbi:MAG: lipopolysaccharide kinase InaA family protein [Candidatus Anammoxibacter sp.]